MIRDATFSEDGSKRFELIRDWTDTLIPTGLNTALWLMLNPSKAGKIKDDPTVKKVVGFSQRWGFNTAVVVNLIPDIATDPWDLPHWHGIDLENAEYIKKWASVADMTILAYGTVPKAFAGRIALPGHIYSAKRLVGSDLYCIDLTSDGSPRHPSRCAYTQNPQRFYGWKD